MENNKEILIADRYRIEKKIASGGMADIYLGEDIRLKRKVAVKILSANYAGDRNFVARFRSEAQVLIKLDHPNIVDIYDWGQFNSSYYIVMEYVDGTSLKELIERKGPLEPDIAAHYAVQICDALGTAHDNSLIHRDIKPQNILISRDNNIKVTDFGIAKSLNTDITKTLNIMGTAHYISPEQARGDVLDSRTDIYSLGIVLYEMLTGDLPFRGDTSIDISLKHISEKPVRPTHLIRNIPKNLEMIVMMCLKKDPLERYRSIRDLRKDLDNFLKRKPVLLGSRRKDFKRSRAFSKGPGKNLGLLTASILAVLFMGLFIAYSILYYQKEPAAEKEIRVPPLENTYLETAEDILSLFGLRMVIAGEKSSDLIPKDYIMEQYPQANTIIEENSEVEVVISSGSDIIEVNTPNVIGLEADKARKLLDKAGFTTGTVSSEFSEQFKEDIVISQSPSCDTPLSPGSSVDIIISKGPERITVPNIVGLDYSYALRHLDGLGLTVMVKLVPTNNEITQPGIVATVEPQPGSEIGTGDIVEIGISTLEPLIEIPGLIGLDISEAMLELGSRNIIYDIIYIETDYSFQKDEVLQQWPGEGYHLPAGSRVLLFVGK